MAIYFLVLFPCTLQSQRKVIITPSNWKSILFLSQFSRMLHFTFTYLFPETPTDKNITQRWLFWLICGTVHHKQQQRIQSKCSLRDFFQTRLKFNHFTSWGLLLAFQHLTILRSAFLCYLTSLSMIEYEQWKKLHTDVLQNIFTFLSGRTFF